MRIVYSFILVILLVFACNPRQKSSENIIPKDKIVQILTDVMIAESAITIEQGNDIDTKVMTKYYYSGVFKKHNITQKQFEESMHYYSKNDKNFNEIFSHVIDSLSKKQSVISRK